MELSEQDKSVRAIDVTTKMFNDAGLNDKTPYRPSYVDFAVFAKNNGAQWEATKPETQKLIWENEQSRKSLILDYITYPYKRLTVRYIALSKNDDTTGGYHIDQIQSFKSTSTQITFNGLDNEKKPVELTITYSGEANSPNQSST